jgi:tRNA nucleotidyltransferase (CCA-adding enzyme)
MTLAPLSLDMSFIPVDVREIMERFRQSGFDVWLVGGGLRDHFSGRVPKDWDLATSAEPRDTIRLFRKVVPVGMRHGTVQVHTDSRDVEVTTIPREGPEGIIEDLGRRDFTMNALALSYPGGFLLDPHRGLRDLDLRILRAVGDARARFREDPLRALRACRFVSVYGFQIRRSTFAGLKEEVDGLARVAMERIRDEMSKLLVGERVVEAFECMRMGGVLRNTLPELLEGYRKKQDASCKYDIYTKALRTVHYCPVSLRVRFAALFQCISKPRVRRRRQGAFEFAPHAESSARMAAEVMERWRMSRKEMREVRALIENQVPKGVGEWSEGDIRRFISRTGTEFLDDLMDLAVADRMSSVDPEKELREIAVLRSRIRKQLERNPPLRIEDLAVDGVMIMKTLKLPPGPRVGSLLRRLQREVLENPDMNEAETLIDFLKKECHT